MLRNRRKRDFVTAVIAIIIGLTGITQRIYDTGDQKAINVVSNEQSFQKEKNLNNEDYFSYLIVESQIQISIWECERKVKRINGDAQLEQRIEKLQEIYVYLELCKERGKSFEKCMEDFQDRMKK